MTAIQTPWDKEIESIGTLFTDGFRGNQDKRGDTLRRLYALHHKAEGYRVAKEESAELVGVCKQILERYAPGGLAEHCWICGFDHLHNRSCLCPQLQAALAKYEGKG